MLYVNNEWKWVVVVNRKVSVPQLLNAIAHLALGMLKQCTAEAAGLFHNYDGSNGQLTSVISNWPVIILQANNSNQLRTLRAALLAAGLPCQAFVDTMIGESAADQIERTKSTDENNVEYFAVMAFGRAEEDLRPLTKKFSLFSQGSSDSYGRGFHTLDPH